MRKTFILFAMALFLVFACEQDEPPLSTVNTVSDVTANAEYTTCTIKCSNKSVDGVHIKMRIVISEEETMLNVVPYDMQVTSGQLTCTVSGLKANLQYYYCFELYTDNDQYRINDVYLFKTKEFLPSTVATLDASNITCSTAVCNGSIIFNGGCEVTERGFKWGVGSSLYNDSIVVSPEGGTEAFSIFLANLEPATNYCYKAYAVNCLDTTYGNLITFTTAADVPTIITTGASNVTSNAATSGGNVTSDGGATVSARGVCWSTIHIPSLSDNHTIDGYGTGSFVSNITSLTPGTTYYVRAYATNSTGTVYGDEIMFTTAATIPTVITTGVSNVTATSVTCGGNVTDDGGATVTARGVCWSTSHNPTISGNHTTNGYGTGNFLCSISGLSAGITYYVRAYATNSAGTAYGNEIVINTSATLPTVTTSSASNISSTSATCGGTVSDAGGATVTARGVCWSTSHNPTTSHNHTSNGSGVGAFSAGITGLTPGTTYYIRAYATNSVGTAYGNEITLTTAATIPTVTTSAANNITATTATSGGNVTNNGGANVTARGVCWGNAHNPSVSGNHTSNGSGNGSFSSSLSGLNSATTYYVRAYATNSEGTAYGNEISFTTSAASPTVTTSDAYNITTTSATCGGNVTGDGGATVTARGVCWSSSHNPTISGSHTTNGSGTGSFTSSITGLSAGTTYYVRAYATNSAGTSYGNEITFTTIAIVVPNVTTTSVCNVTSSYAACGGTVDDDGGGTVTARGVCWSSSHNPTISGSHTTNNSGTGSFVSNITGLSANTTYYVRAYATNSAGTAYGNEISFNTPAAAPTGALPGLFSVSATQQVRFSKGNLQYTNTGSHTVAGGGTKTGKWRFAEHQYDYIGSANSNISSSYTGWIDLFGWGTSGWNNGNTYYQPYSSGNSNNDSDGYGYGPRNGSSYTYSLTDTYANADWGVYNAISNGGNTPNQWRTLTKVEWYYLLVYRSTTSGIRYAKGKVNGTPGLIIVPDNWCTNTYTFSNPNDYNGSCNDNIVSLNDWNTIEAAGCVFLPAAGRRQGTAISDIGSFSDWYYWATTNQGDWGAYAIFSGMFQRNWGLSVRLVKDCN